MDNKTIPCLQETHVKTKDTHRLKVKGWKKYFTQMGMRKKAGLVIITLGKIDFKTKAITTDQKNKKDI